MSAYASSRNSLSIRVKILSFQCKSTKKYRITCFIITFVLKLIFMNSLELIRKPVESELTEFKSLFDASLQSDTPLLDNVLSYIRKRNGKMMRPILVLLMAKLYGSVCEATLHAALSLELLHMASLVHDDVVDESDKRRGQSSVNALYDNKVSVLVGDFMLATSLAHAAKTSHIELVKLVARLGQNLSEGEIIQLANTSNREFSEEIYFDVIRKKTAALFAASAESGAISVDAADKDVADATPFGELIGIAFQIKDDIFDYFDSDAIGKPTGNDMLEGKLTLPALYVLNKTTDSSVKETALRIRALEATKEEISDFVSYVKEHGGIEYARETMMKYRDKAIELLPASGDKAIKESLTTYVDYVIQRDK